MYMIGEGHPTQVPLNLSAQEQCVLPQIWGTIDQIQKFLFVSWGGDEHLANRERGCFIFDLGQEAKRWWAVGRVLVNQGNLAPAGSSQETKGGNGDWILHLSSVDGVILTGHKLLG